MVKNDKHDIPFITTQSLWRKGKGKGLNQIFLIHAIAPFFLFHL